LLILVDESGDPGFKLSKGSTRYFVVAMVIFRDYNQAEQASAAIECAQQALNIKPEFRFNKCCNAARDGFFTAVHPFKFRVRALVVDKASIYSTNLRDDSKRFYAYFTQMLMRHDSGTLSGARIKIDCSGARKFKQELNNYLGSSPD
jgi:hypothetical protein